MTDNIIQTETVTLPAGFTTRAATLADLDAAVKLFNRVAMERDGKETTKADVIRVEWTNPVFDMAANTLVVLTPDSDLVGYIELWADPPMRPRAWLRVHPDYVEHGLERYLLNWAVKETRNRLMPKCPPEARVALQVRRPDFHTRLKAIYDDMGMAEVRYAHRMRITLDDTPDAPPMPDGITLRPMRYPDELPAVTHMIIDAFRDHWGFIMPEDVDKEIAEWRHDMDNDPIFDAAVLLLAVDDATGEIAGVGLNRDEAWDEPDVAHVDVLGVARAHRRRGLGYALLMHSFKVLYERGHRTITLYVDAGSLTGATRLYEKAGMHVEKVHVTHELELRPGIEMMTTHIAD